MTIMRPGADLSAAVRLQAGSGEPVGWPFPNPARPFFGRPTPVPGSWNGYRRGSPTAILPARGA
jgi:hypothetical protein